MTLKGEARLLRIFIIESDKWQNQPLYEELVKKARSVGLAGGTVLRGIEGFGVHNRLHTTRILRLSEDLPVVLEFIDNPDKIDSFLQEVEDMIEESLVTVESIEVRNYPVNKEGTKAQ